MPKTPIDYSKTIIYRIVCKDVSIKESYVGATTDFTRRKSEHKRSCNNNCKMYNYNVYQFIRANGGWNYWDMIEIEKYNAVDKLTQSKRERFWLEFYEATLNMVIPSRPDSEWRNNNQDDLIKYSKNYYRDHKEQFFEYGYNYRKKNKEQIIEDKKYYYQENKTKINENRKEKITCECGIILSKASLTRHKQTKKHLAFTGNTINIRDSAGYISSIRDKLEPEGL